MYFSDILKMPTTPRRTPKPAGGGTGKESSVMQTRGRNSQSKVEVSTPEVKGRGQSKNLGKTPNTPVSCGDEPKRGRGRPKKNEEDDKVDTPQDEIKKGRGRPKKADVDEEEVAPSTPGDNKRGRGRPRKNTDTETSESPHTTTPQSRVAKNSKLTPDVSTVIIKTEPDDSFHMSTRKKQGFKCVCGQSFSVEYLLEDHQRKCKKAIEEQKSATPKSIKDVVKKEPRTPSTVKTNRESSAVRLQQSEKSKSTPKVGVKDVQNEKSKDTPRRKPGLKANISGKDVDQNKDSSEKGSGDENSVANTEDKISTESSTESSDAPILVPDVVTSGKPEELKEVAQISTTTTPHTSQNRKQEVKKILVVTPEGLKRQKPLKTTSTLPVVKVTSPIKAAEKKVVVVMGTKETEISIDGTQNSSEEVVLEAANQDNGQSVVLEECTLNSTGDAEIATINTSMPDEQLTSTQITTATSSSEESIISETVDKENVSLAVKSTITSGETLPENIETVEPCHTGAGDASAVISQQENGEAVIHTIPADITASNMQEVVLDTSTGELVVLGDIIAQVQGNEGSIEGQPIVEEVNDSEVLTTNQENNDVEAEKKSSEMAQENVEGNDKGEETVNDNENNEMEEDDDEDILDDGALDGKRPYSDDETWTPKAKRQRRSVGTAPSTYKGKVKRMPKNSVSLLSEAAKKTLEKAKEENKELDPVQLKIFESLVSVTTKEEDEIGLDENSEVKIIKKEEGVEDVQLQMEENSEVAAVIYNDDEEALVDISVIESMVDLESTECAICFQKFKSPKYMRNHLVTHTGNKRFTCQVCSKRFMRKYDLQQHMMRVHSFIKTSRGKIVSKEEEFLNANNENATKACMFCESKFTTQFMLDNHLEEAHSTERPFKCDICNASFSSSKKLDRHKDAVHSERLHQCEHCDKSFRFLYALKEHEKTHNEAKPFLCDDCGKGFALAKYLQKHKQRHTVPEVFNKIYDCKYCEKVFENLHEYQQHIRTHTDTEDRIHQCDQCPKRFFKYAHLKRHIMTHSTVRSFQCEYCEKRYKDPDTLRKHIRFIHRTADEDGNRKEYPCPFCDKVFYSNGHRKRHLIKHTGMWICQYTNFTLQRQEYSHFKLCGIYLHCV